MTTIVQITPEIGPGTGVGAVAYHLEQEWQRQGVTVKRFTLGEAGGGWLPSAAGAGPIAARIALLARVGWFSTVGTRRARAYLRDHPDELSICHNDALAGDVYVNHGIVQAAMKARGHYWLRMVRNPLHLFTSARDHHRYSQPGTHRLVVNLVHDEERLLREVYPGLAIPTVVIGNGVDVDRFQPPTDAARAEARHRLGVGPSDVAVIFVGNEFGRKGLDVLVSAVGALPDNVHLVVVGGDEDMIRTEQGKRSVQALDSRAHFAGAQRDPRPWLYAADCLAMPSAYESYGLVVLEALACGLPVVATATGCAPDVIEQGVNGLIVRSDVDDLAHGLQRALELPRRETVAAARASAMEHSWHAVAHRYLSVMTALRGSAVE